MGAQIDITRLRVEQLEEEVQKVKTEQKGFISKVPLRNYPKEGLGLKKLSWKEVFEKEKQAALQPKIETTLSQTLAPYFGLAQVIVSIDVPSQTLTISLTGDRENMSNQKMIETNVEVLVEEAKEIPKLTQIHIEVIMTAEKKIIPFIVKPFYENKTIRCFLNWIKQQVNRKEKTSRGKKEGQLFFY